MRQYVYDPPMGSPPFEFVVNGGPVIAHPPDQFWKRGKKPRRVAVKIDPISGGVVYEKYAQDDIWVLDEAKNRAAKLEGASPDNTIWLEDSDFRASQLGKYAPFNAYLRPVKELDDRYRKTRVLVEQEQEQELAKLRAMFEREKQAIMDLAKKEIHELRASEAQILEAAAQEIGTTSDQLQKVLKKHRTLQKEQAGAGA